MLYLRIPCSEEETKAEPDPNANTEVYLFSIIMCFTVYEGKFLVSLRQPGCVLCSLQP